MSEGAAIRRLTHTTNQLVPVLQAVEKAAVNVVTTHSGRLYAWIDTTIKPAPTHPKIETPKLLEPLTDVRLTRSFIDINAFNKAAGHGHLPHLGDIATPNAITTATNPSHIGVDLDESKKDDGRPLLDLDL